jgi:TetR/AcrR family transcriptional repressor of nem operon
MASRTALKEESLRRILDACASRLRQEGLAGAAIANVMRDAGLTHGAFYVHFPSKNELAAAALRHALLDNRRRWVGTLKRESWAQRLHRLARRYLTRTHRDHPADGCALAAVATEAARSDAGFRRAYETELRKSLHDICSGSEAQAKPTAQCLDDAIAFMALCVGGISLARAVSEQEFSDRILDACAAAASRIASTPSEA